MLIITDANAIIAKYIVANLIGVLFFMFNTPRYGIAVTVHKSKTAVPTPISIVESVPDQFNCIEDSENILRG